MYTYRALLQLTTSLRAAPYGRSSFALHRGAAAHTWHTVQGMAHDHSLFTGLHHKHYFLPFLCPALGFIEVFIVLWFCDILNFTERMCNTANTAPCLAT